MNSIPQAMKNRTQGHPEMNFANYGIEPILMQFGRLRVTKFPTFRPDGTVGIPGDEYVVDAVAQTCSCPSWQHLQNRGGGPCKHLVNARRLIGFQVGVYEIEQKNIKARVQVGSMGSEQGRVQGQRLSDATWALLAIADNLWGAGDMMVPAEYDNRGASAAGRRAA